MSVGVNSINASAEDETIIKGLQKSAVFRNATMAAAHMAQAQAEVMKSVAVNKNGAMMGFMGINMAQAAGGFNTNAIYQNQTPQPAPAVNSCKCACGTENTGKFCAECGASKPSVGSTCSCCSANKGKFWPECCEKKPAAAPRILPGMR